MPEPVSRYNFLLTAFSPFCKPVNLGRHVAGTKSIINIDCDDAVRAGIDHRQKRRKAVEAGAIADRCRNGDDGILHEASDDRSKSPFHPGDGDDAVRAPDQGFLGKDPVDAAHAHVVNALDMRAEVFSRLGRFFGDESLMGSTSAITAVYWISEVWQHVGWNSIIYLAALAGVDTSLYEAAKIDGAGRLQLIRYVDLPAIMPTCAILLIMNMGSVLNVGFDKIYLMQNSLNRPATEVIATYTYKIGIINGQYSYSTAIGLFNTLVNFVFLITANAIAKRVSDTSIF